MGVGFLRGADFDQVEVGNLNRQVLYDVADISKPKVLAAAGQLTRFNPDTVFEPVQREITGPQDIIELAQGVDLVAFCADRPQGIGMWMNQASLTIGMPFIVGGYHGVAAEVGPFVIPSRTGCLVCSEVDIADSGNGEIPELAWTGEAFWLHHPNIHFVTALAANLLCSDICKHIIRMGQPATYNHRYILDTEQFTLTSTNIPRSLVCSACGQENRGS
jgi:bacteriocin biosynthesis cyclodehydratase domain-containing protein